MKSFSKKSVALIILTVILFGFSSFGIARASDPTTLQYSVPGNTSSAPIQPTYTDPSGQRYYYVGDGSWRLLPIGSSNPNITTLGMQQFHSMSSNMVSLGTQYDNAKTTYDSTHNSGSSFWGVAAKDLADFTVGILTAPVFYAVAITLFIIGSVLAGILGILGTLFDTVIFYSIYNIGDILNQLNSVWVLFRDIVNVFFIFILLYIAIKKIVGTSGFNEKKALGNLIKNAIFVNFSMFIAKFIIDAGNIFAIGIYNQINAGSGIGWMIVSKLHLTELFQMSLLTSFVSGTGQMNIIIILLLKVIIIATVIYVFFWAILIFLGRAGMLIYLVITSPVAYFGDSIPKLKAIGDDWWSEFGNQVLVAPVFMLFMLIISRVLGLTDSIANAIKDSSSNSSINISGYFVFLLVILLLNRALKETKQLSGKVAEMALTATKGALALGAAAATGGATLYGAGITGALALGSTGAAGAAAGKTGLSAARARLSFAGEKGIAKLTGQAGGVGKFVAGGFEKEPGYIAKGLTAARGTINAGIKTATGEDLIGLQKALRKATEENEKKIIQTAEAVGPQKARDTKKQLETTRGNIEGQAKERLENEDERLEKVLKNNQEILSKVTTNVKATKTEIDAAQANVNAAQSEITKFKAAKDQGAKLENERRDHQKAAEDINKDKSSTPEQKSAAQASVDAADAAIENFKKAQLKPFEEEVAGEMGTTLNEIENANKKAEEDIVEGERRRNEFIKKTAEKAGSFFAGREYFGALQSKKDREKVIAKLRAQKGKYSADQGNFWKSIQKAAKEAGLETPEEKGGKPTESKPKEGSGEPRAPGGGL